MKKKLFGILIITAIILTGCSSITNAKTINKNNSDEKTVTSTSSEPTYIRFYVTNEESKPLVNAKVEWYWTYDIMWEHICTQRTDINGKTNYKEYIRWNNPFGGVGVLIHKFGYEPSDPDLCEQPGEYIQINVTMKKWSDDVSKTKISPLINIPFFLIFQRIFNILWNIGNIKV